MEKKIMYTENAPDKKFLWLHTKNNNLVLEVFGNKGWETVGDDSIKDVIDELIKENKELHKQLKVPSPIQVKIPKLTEDCSKKELLEVISRLINILVQTKIIKL